MNTLVFVAISVMSCNGNVNNIQRCTYQKETIVRAEQLQILNEKLYFLGPISREVQKGCLVTLGNGDTLVSGKPCRRLMGEK